MKQIEGICFIVRSMLTLAETEGQEFFCMGQPPENEIVPFFALAAATGFVFTGWYPEGPMFKRAVKQSSVEEFGRQHQILSVYEQTGSLAQAVMLRWS